MAALGAALGGKEIVVLPPFEDMRALCYAGGGFADQLGLGGGVTGCQINGDDVDGKVFEIGIGGAMEFSVCG